MSLSSYIGRPTGRCPPGGADKASYVLYLRSFGTEYLTQRIPDQEENLLRNLRNLLFTATFGATEEQRLAKALAAVGVGIALGKRGEPPPEGGFQRLYVSDDEWQAEVERLMSGARLVVLRIGNSAGLLWELERARQIVAADRLVILIPGDSDLISETAVPGETELETVYVCPGLRLPMFSATNVHKTSIAGVISFDPDWTARGMPLSVETYSFKHALEAALDPIFLRLNIHLRLRRLYRLPPPAVVYSLLLFGVMLLVGAGLIQVTRNFFKAPTLPSLEIPEMPPIDFGENSDRLAKLKDDIDRMVKAQKESASLAKRLTRLIDSQRSVGKNRGKRRARRR